MPVDKFRPRLGPKLNITNFNQGSQQSIISPQKVMTKGTSFGILEKQSRLSSGRTSKIGDPFNKKSKEMSTKGFKTKAAEYIKQNDSSDSDLKGDEHDMRKKKRGSVILKSHNSPDISQNTGMKGFPNISSNRIMDYYTANKPTQPGRRGLSNTLESPMITYKNKLQGTSSFQLGIHPTENSLASTNLPSNRVKQANNSQETSVAQGIITSRERSKATNMTQSSLPAIKLRNKI